MSADELPIVLDRTAGTPLAVQVADALRVAASTGALRIGDRLSSTRELAARLRVSRTVTVTAYEQLFAEGWLSGRRGAGTFVVAAPPAGEVALRPRSARRPVSAAEPGGRGDQAGVTVVDLTPGRPCLAVLDRAAWRRAWRAAADDAPTATWDPAGRPEYRAAVVDHLLRHRGLGVSPRRVVATSGTTSALGELASLLPPGSAVALEEPGYQRAAETLVAHGLRVLPAPVDAGGLRVDRLPAGLAAVYCTPAHQFPLGPRLSADRRVALVERARAQRFLVVEDDYDGELRYDVAPLPLLASLGPDVVAHLGTASKLLTPALGAGWLVAPPPLHRGLLAARTLTSRRPSPSGHLVFAAFAGYGDLARHLRRLRRELAIRREMVAAALRGIGVSVLGDAAGAHLRVPLPDGPAERAVIESAERAGVLLTGLGEYHRGRPTVFGISVGYAGPGRDELGHALDVVTELVRRVR